MTIDEMAEQLRSDCSINIQVFARTEQKPPVVIIEFYDEYDNMTAVTADPSADLAIKKALSL